MKNYLTNLWRKCRKPFASLVLALGVAAPVISHAEGEPTFTVDTSAAASAITTMSSSVSTFLTSNMMTAVLAVIGAGVVIWLVFLCWKFIKRAGQKAG